jgi:hypothetical protein
MLKRFVDGLIFFRPGGCSAAAWNFCGRWTCSGLEDVQQFLGTFIEDWHLLARDHFPYRIS